MIKYYVTKKVSISTLIGIIYTEMYNDGNANDGNTNHGRTQKTYKPLKRTRNQIPWNLDKPLNGISNLVPNKTLR